MIDPESLEKLAAELHKCILGDRAILDELRRDVKGLLPNTQRIHSRSVTAVSLVGTDGGNNRVEFDPFMVQLVRVVDSSQNEYCLEAITPTSDVQDLSRRHVDVDGRAQTALGEMMVFLGVRNLWDLSPMIQRRRPEEPPKPSWVQVYRELMEWAVLFRLVREKDFGSDTLIIVDGYLRSKVFKQDLFARYRRGVQEGMDRQWKKSRRRLYLAGIAKHSRVLDRYRLAMALEGVLERDYPCFVEVPRELEDKTYVWGEYARGDDRETEGGEINKFVAGKMFFVKLGSRPRDPIWAIDLFQSQAGKAQEIFGYMLADAVDGFPVPFYPRCLQRAHEHAALVDFDMDILQRETMRAMRVSLGEQSEVLDAFELRTQDIAARRYQ